MSCLLRAAGSDVLVSTAAEHPSLNLYQASTPSWISSDAAPTTKVSIGMCPGKWKSWRDTWFWLTVVLYSTNSSTYPSK